MTYDARSWVKRSGAHSLRAGPLQGSGYTESDSTFIRDTETEMVTSTATPYDTPGPGKTGLQRVRWGSVSAGLVIALVTQMLMAILGLAIGLTAVSPEDGVSGQAAGWGMTIWGILTILVSLFAGAYAAGYLSNALPKRDGALHGLLVGALALLLTAYLASSGIGMMVSGTFSAIGTTVQAAGPAASNELASLDMEGMDAEAMQEQLRRAREELRQQMPAAREGMAQAADIGATAAWTMLLAALIGLGVAWWGGGVGADRSAHAVRTAR